MDVAASEFKGDLILIGLKPTLCISAERQPSRLSRGLAGDSIAVAACS